MEHAASPADEEAVRPSRMTARDRDDVFDVLSTVIACMHGGDDLEQILCVVARGVVQATCFGVIAVNLVMADGDVKVVAVEGNDATRNELLGRVEPASRWAQVIDGARRVGALCHYRHDDTFVDDMLSWVPDVEPPTDPDLWHPLDALFAPLLDSHGDLIGVLSVDLPDGGRRPGADQLQLLELFARHAALAIEHSRRRDLERQVGVLAERVRIAESVHDAVIQELYAASMNIAHELASHATTVPATHLEAALDDLDSATESLRTLIGTLRAADGPPELIAALRRVATRAARALTVEPVLTYTGDPARVSGLIATELVAALTDVLTEIARRDDVVSVAIRLTIDTESVALTIVIDRAAGAGPGSGRNALGVARTATRATQLGATLDQHDQPQGSTITWTVPRTTTLAAS